MDKEEERSYVIVEWEDGGYQVRSDSAHVLCWLEETKQLTVCAGALTREEAQAIFKLYPKDKRIKT